MRPAVNDGLDAWLTYAEHLNEKPIDMGLTRMKAMIERLGIAFTCPVFTVAGTNGKGSTCAMLESILRNAGNKVCMHTSPHLLRFNERALIDGKEAEDAAIVEALSAVDAARGDMPLTYFEMTGLAVLLLFMKAKPDAVILEIGLGGRLDAMNAIDTSCGIVCAIGIDHVAFLGNTREKIAYEKSCIYRQGRPAVVTDRDVPATLIDNARAIDAELNCYGRDFETKVNADGTFDFSVKGQTLWQTLPHPALAGDNQIMNAAGVLAALYLMRDKLPVTEEAVRKGLTTVRITGRFETVQKGEEVEPEIIFDVGHNPQAAASLAANLKRTREPGRKTFAVLGMLADKDMTGVIRTVSPEVDHWFVTGLGTARGASLEVLKKSLMEAGLTAADITECASPAAALSEAQKAAMTCGRPVRIIGFGSFVTVSALIEALRSDKKTLAVWP